MNDDEIRIHCLLRKTSRCGSPGEDQKSLDVFMSILTDDERFVVTRHLIDGIVWNRVVYEYNHKPFRAKRVSLSTLRRMQHNSISRMADYARQQTHDGKHDYCD